VDYRNYLTVNFASTAGISSFAYCKIFSSAVTKGQQNWWVDWVSHRLFCKLLVKLFLLCEAKSDFDETWCE